MRKRRPSSRRASRAAEANHAVKNLRLFPLGLGVAVIHILSGSFILLGYHAVTSVTPLALLYQLTDNATAVGLTLLIVGFVALRPFMVKDVHQSQFVVCMAPQQILLLMHAVSVIWSAAVGHYPDGYAPKDNGVFILNDQDWLLLVVFSHTYKYYALLFHYEWLIGRSNKH